ncbi:hypothetical protein DPMN_168431 [Dreissena polymorpha]|uniref:Uncharacterized protein n=1 Tax=Dreissena polymorpha TaxID=45954 RepID=A0A9D4IZB1_DREPO|nr:hypothetical protein DPMN_168431 [Dreissena polymorpha]
MWALENGKHEYCKEQLTEIEGKMYTRNKCIRIADSSSGGWETVRQYENESANGAESIVARYREIAAEVNV